MATYKPNKDGYYRATIVVGHTPDGREKRQNVRSKSLSEFKEKLRAAQNLREQGYDFDSKNMTVGEWADQWLETYKRPHVREHCAQTYEINIRLHIKPVIGHILLSDVKPFQLQSLLNTLDGKSKSTAQKIYFCLRQMFSQAYSNGLIVRNIATDLTVPNTVEGTRRPLTEEERAAAEKVIPQHRAGLWVATMLYAGLRPEETVALMWSDICLDEDNESITVERAAEWVHGRAHIKGVKGKDKKKGEEAKRTIPISGILVELLKSAPRKGLYVFTPEQSDGMLTQTNVRRLWHSFKRELDIVLGAEVYRNQIVQHALDEAVTPYYLRHTYCTSLFEMGVDLKTAQYLMGHADIKTTANIYTHFTKSAADRAAKVIRAKFKETCQTRAKK